MYDDLSSDQIEFPEKGISKEKVVRKEKPIRELIEDFILEYNWRVPREEREKAVERLFKLLYSEKIDPEEKPLDMPYYKKYYENEPERKIYEIWCNIKDHFYDYEGVNLLGSVEAESFQKACDRFFWNNSFYDSESLEYKKCKLYDTQMKACCDGEEEGVLS